MSDLKPTLAVDQTLWYAPERGPGKLVTVTKVGKRWAYLSNKQRIDMDSWEADGGDYSSPGRCFLSESDHHSYLEASKAWSDFKAAVRMEWTMPEGLTTARIAEVTEMLGLGRRKLD